MMANKSTHLATTQHPSPQRPLRSATRATRSASGGSNTSMEEQVLTRQTVIPKQKQASKNKEKTSPRAGSRSSAAAVASEDENDGASGEDDEGSDQDGQPAAPAPSGSPKGRRAHQTGLSIDMSRASLHHRTHSKKRLRSVSSNDDDDLNDSEGGIERKKLAKVAKTQAEDSDDEDYTGVDMISDSEEEDSGVGRWEERALIESFEQEEASFLSPHAEEQQNANSDADEWNGFDLDTSPGPATTYFSDQMTRTEPYAFDIGNDGNEPADEVFDPNSSPIQTPERRVRFALDSWSSSDSDSEGDDDVPGFGLRQDVFLDQDSLDPSFRHLIDNDEDEDKSSTAGSDPESESNSDSEASNETVRGQGSTILAIEELDDGETTDEDIQMPKTISSPHAMLRNRSQSDTSIISRDSRSQINQRNLAVARQQIKSRGPRLGSFVTDPSKPYAFFGAQTQALVWTPARIRRQTLVGVDLLSHRSSASSGLESSLKETTVASTLTSPLMANEIRAIDFAEMPLVRRNSVPTSGITSTLADDILGGVANGHGSLFSGEVVGPSAALSKLQSSNTNRVFEHDEDDWGDDDDDELEAKLDLNAFINFGNDSDAEDRINSGVDQCTESPQTPSVAEYKMAHYHPAVATSFRRNQDRFSCSRHGTRAGPQVRPANPDVLNSVPSRTGSWDRRNPSGHIYFPDLPTKRDVARYNRRREKKLRKTKRKMTI